MKKFVLPTLFIVSLVFAGTALAQQWIYFKSKTGLFKLRIYNNVKEDINTFRLNDKSVAMYGQTVSTFDQRAFKDVVKNYIIKYEQTLGYTLSQQDAAKLIHNELQLYESYYSSLGGILREKKDLFYKDGFPAGEIYVKYDDPQVGEQSIRITVLFTETAKIQHIISGPEDMMTSFKTREHYNSLDVDNGYVREDGSIQEEWRSVTSPMRLFTLYLPEPGSPYFPKDQVSYNDQHVERVSSVFHDPIWNMDVYYNVYGYIPNGKVNDARAQSITTERHIKRHRLSADGLKYKHLTVANQNIAEISYDIIAPKGKPNVRWVKLRVQHADNKIVVHELLGPRHLVESPFFDYLVDNAKFHPQLYITASELQKLKEAEAKERAAKGEELKKLLEQSQEEEEPADEETEEAPEEEEDPNIIYESDD
ncbi:MAG: hypothetical protein JKY71_00795 [Alphaproteobacteria bacterium]|nr:hypothetical protein [Alphaproteobacteria bacterium]